MCNSGMLRKYKILLTVSALVLLGFGIVSPLAQASPELSATPVDGGNTIRFSRGDLNIGVTKEVRIRVINNDNVRVNFSFYDAVFNHQIKCAVTHVFTDVKYAGIKQNQNRKQSAQIQIKVVL